MDKILTLPDGGLGLTFEKTRELNEEDVDLYVWITDYNSCADKKCTLGRAPLSGACDRSEKTSLNWGPTRGVLGTAEVIYYHKVFLKNLYWF